MCHETTCVVNLCICMYTRIELKLGFFSPGALHLICLLWCLPEAFVTRGGETQPHPARHSSPVWAGIVLGCWCSKGSSGSVDEAATTWSSLSGCSQFCGGRHYKCVYATDTSTTDKVNLPVLKLYSSCFVCTLIHQLLWLKKNRLRRK